MAQPVPVTGSNNYLEVEMTPGANDFMFICVLDTIDRALDKAEEELMLLDCNSASVLPSSATFMNSIKEAYNISGIASMSDAAYVRLRTLAGVDTAANFRWNFGVALSGGKKRTFVAKVSGLKETKAGHQTTKMSCTLTVQGTPAEVAL